ncbi:homoserine O-acetyltransferase/O-succinyltransferase family protein, partial [Escherichia coli]
MPIRVPDELPAVNFLREENVFVMTTSRASGQEIRPLKVLILNLMPKKIETENQFLRLLSNSPLQVDIQLLRIDSRESRNTPAEHLNNFYCNFEDIQEQNFDGLIVTGAPLGLVEFNDVAYWPQIIWRDLVDVIVEPVGKQQITVTTPARSRFVLRIIVREIVIR